MAKKRQKRTTDRPDNVTDRLLVKIELDALEATFRDGERSAAVAEMLDDLFDKFDEADIEAELLRRLRSMELGEDPTPTIWALGEIADEGTISKLWDIVRAPDVPLHVKSVTLVVLENEGEEIAPSDIMAPLSSADSEESERMLRQSLAEIVRMVVNARSSDELMQMISTIEGMEKVVPGGDEVFFHIIELLLEQRDQNAATFLHALSTLSSSRELQNAARDALSVLEEQGIVADPVLTQMFEESEFHTAYASDESVLQDQQQIFGAWKREEDKIQALVFLIDFQELNGAIKDFFLTRNMTRRELMRMVHKAETAGIPMVELTLDELRNKVKTALEVSARTGHTLPEEYEKHRAFVENMLNLGPAAEEPSETPLKVEDMEEEWGPPDEVEQLFTESMVEADYSEKQILNARRLWRDFREKVAPRIRKPEAWAAGVEYAIVTLDLVPGETQQSLAEKYDVSKFSISTKYRDILSAVSVLSSDPRYTLSDDVLDEEDWDEEENWDEEEDWDEEEEDWEEEDYQEYLELYKQQGKGHRKLSKEEFIRFDGEMMDLLTWKALRPLTKRERKRIKELSDLLLIKDDLLS